MSSLTINDRLRLRRKQNLLLDLAAGHYDDDVRLSVDAPLTLGMLRECIYPEHESLIDRTITTLWPEGVESPTEFTHEPRSHIQIPPAQV